MEYTMLAAKNIIDYILDYDCQYVLVVENKYGIEFDLINPANIQRFLTDSLDIYHQVRDGLVNYSNVLFDRTDWNGPNTLFAMLPDNPCAMQ